MVTAKSKPKPLSSVNHAAKTIHHHHHRSQQSEVLRENDILRNLQNKKFCKKNPFMRGLHFNEVAGWRLATLLKNEAPAQIFPCKVWKFLRTSFVENTSGRILVINTYSNALPIMPLGLRDLNLKNMNNEFHFR